MRIPDIRPLRRPEPRPVASSHRWWIKWTLVALLVVGTWAYAGLIYIPNLEHTRKMGGDLFGPYRSDLYPRWLGAQKLLWEGSNPYSAGVTAAIQQGFYGRTLTPTDAYQDQQGFAYPLYIVFLLAPLTVFPFEVIWPLALIGLLLLLAGSILWWITALDWNLDRPSRWMLVLCGCSLYPAIRMLYLQQLSGLVIALLAGAAVCIVRRRYEPAGMLLACALIKPQVSGLVVAWLVLWAASHRPERSGLLRGFGVTIFLLLAGSFLLLPGWFNDWLQALIRYRQYAPGTTLLEVWLPPAIALGLLVILGGLLLLAAWRARRAAPPGSLTFSVSLALTSAYSLLLIPGWEAYNHLLLYPGMLLILQYLPHMTAAGWGSRLVTIVTLALMLVFPVLATSLVVGEGIAWVVSGPGGMEMLDRWWFLPSIASVILPIMVLIALARLAWFARQRETPADAGMLLNI